MTYLQFSTHVKTAERRSHKENQKHMHILLTHAIFGKYQISIIQSIKVYD